MCSPFVVVAVVVVRVREHTLTVFDFMILAAICSPGFFRCVNAFVSELAHTHTHTRADAPRLDGVRIWSKCVPSQYKFEHILQFGRMPMDAEFMHFALIHTQRTQRGRATQSKCVHFNNQ